MLTEQQKSSIRLYLGYPDRYRFRNSRLESVIDNLSPDAEVQVATLLENLATVESALLKAGVTQAGVKRVDEIWFENGKVRVIEIRKTGRMYASRLSIITGVPIYSDAFGTNGYFGDSFLPGNGEPTGGFFNLG